MTESKSRSLAHNLTKLHTLIIGAGFAGLCMGIKLKEAGLSDFLILEKADDLGGTWRENTYPGAECDIPSALYSYSFEHNADWQSKWSGQAQILKYQHDTALKYGLENHLRYGCSVDSASYDDARARWQVRTSDGQEFEAQHLVTAVGQLHYPSTPSFPNAEAFQGQVFHSAKWDHAVDLTNKRVAVIGNAASAVQFIPEIAKKVKSLSVFQRSANWILPKMDRPYAKWEQRLSARVPMVIRVYRWYIWAAGEYGVLSAINGNRLTRWVVRTLCLRNLKRHINDPELRTKLTPNYPVGAKRVLFSDHFYPALARDNVALETASIESFTSRGLKTSDGAEHEFDVIIYGTGFQTNPFLAHIDVRGRNGLSIRDAWRNGAHAYYGVSTHGFPNLHMLYGPNTNLGHTSIIIMLEAQVDYVVRLMQRVQSAQASACEIDQAEEAKFNQEMQARLSTMAFSQVANSWYMDGNKITNNWAGGTKEYVRRLQQVDWSVYRLN
ncbi:flavin-containing monooxygenase [Arenicella xantha]|uniref:Cation diffusion facilitator CzcD-associated flavoprotein CzcO n=1 Tax=Arenicella xantha TaxID=644221 RepID=A0A395JM57_9GAMM|nr:NAD(P)/FAD-dependent oxidoreductase [Arenicella xantha]RBP52721.1 cation diffusion facilitator CzcD-associated flavoprotein CzcO [Arenicella xantha]